MKKILGISLVAMMAVTAANAEIASKAYVIQEDNAIKNNVIGSLSGLNDGITNTSVVAAINSVASNAAAGVSGLDKTAEAVRNGATGQFVKNISETDGLVSATFGTIAEGSTNGTIDVDGTDVAVHGLGSAAYTASTAYDTAGAADTAEQNAKDYADSLASNYDAAGTAAAAQTAAEGYTDSAIGELGSRLVDNVSTPYNVKDYVDDAVSGATSSANTAIAGLDYAGSSDAGVVTQVTEADGVISVTKAKVTTSEIADNAGIVKGQLDSTVQTSLGKADSAVQSVVEGDGNGQIKVDGTNIDVHGLGSAAYVNTTAFTPSVTDINSQGGAGKYALTATVTGNANDGYTVSEYKWELIERNSSNQ